MRKLFFQSILFSFISTIAAAQEVAADINYTTTVNNSSKALIFYSAKQKLSIDDFEGRPDAGSNAVAITSSGFAFNAGFHSSGTATTLSVVVYCNFNKNKSWMKATGKNNYILGHEQLHFDISYLSTLHFIKELKKIKFTTNNYSKLLEKIYNNAAKEMEAMQLDYDAATMNGQLKDKQSAWSERINEEIENASTE